MREKENRRLACQKYQQKKENEEGDMVTESSPHLENDKTNGVCKVRCDQNIEVDKILKFYFIYSVEVHKNRICF